MRNVGVEQIVLKKLYILQNKLQEHLFICNCGSPDSVFFGWKGYRNHQNNFTRERQSPIHPWKLLLVEPRQSLPSASRRIGGRSSWGWGNWKNNSTVKRRRFHLNLKSCHFLFPNSLGKQEQKITFAMSNLWVIQTSFISTTQSMPTAKSAWFFLILLVVWPINPFKSIRNCMAPTGPSEVPLWGSNIISI